MGLTAFLQHLSLNVFTTTQVLILFLLGIVSWILLRSVAPPRRKKGKPIPGPIGIPIWGYLPFLGPEPYKTLKQMSEKYGDVIGLYFGTKYTVVLNTYTTMKEVLNHPGAQDRAPNMFDFFSKSGFLVRNGEEWIEQRRFCRTASRDIGLGRGYWEELILEETENLTNKLKSTKGEAFDISRDLNTSIASNIFSLLIGRRLKEVEEGDKIQLSMDFNHVTLNYTGPAVFASLIPGLRKIFETFRIGGFDWAAQIVKDFDSFISEEINRHKTSTATKGNNDFINIYLEKLAEMEKSKNTKHHFSEPNLHGNVVALFLGSSDTIYKSLCWLLRLMAVHQGVQSKVYAELMETVGKEGRARYEEREKIPYTFATIMEGQRVSSILPFSTPRSITQDIQVQGMIIPKGSQVAANLWALHNDPEYWVKPELFKPERFLTDDGTKLRSHVESYAPFSYGRRNCPGTSIAYMEILFYFSEIIKKFEVCLPPGVKAEFKIVDGLVQGLEPQALCFKERRNVT